MEMNFYRGKEMNRFRYVDKKVLCNYDLSEELFTLLGVEVEDLIPLRKVFILLSNKGKKILKITETTDERIEFIDKALNYIRINDKNILNYSKNVKGKLITEWKNKRYILLALVLLAVADVNSIKTIAII